MLRHFLAAVAVVSTFGCAAPPAQPDAMVSDPEIQAATTACEQKYASHALTSWSQVAECERDLALPEEQRQQPSLSGLYAQIWRDRIELYAKVDRGALTKEAADRQNDIDADNWFNIIRGIRRV
jgi:hypothetical protein